MIVLELELELLNSSSSSAINSDDDAAEPPALADFFFIGLFLGDAGPEAEEAAADDGPGGCDDFPPFLLPSMIGLFFFLLLLCGVLVLGVIGDCVYIVCPAPPEPPGDGLAGDGGADVRLVFIGPFLTFLLLLLLLSWEFLPVGVGGPDMVLWTLSGDGE